MFKELELPYAFGFWRHWITLPDRARKVVSTLFSLTNKVSSKTAQTDRFNWIPQSQTTGWVGAINKVGVLDEILWRYSARAPWLAQLISVESLIYITRRSQNLLLIKRMWVEAAFQRADLEWSESAKSAHTKDKHHGRRYSHLHLWQPRTHQNHYLH